MKKVTVTRIYEGWSEKCPYCPKVIEASTKEQVKYRMKIHKLNCKKRKNETQGKNKRK